MPRYDPPARNQIGFIKRLKIFVAMKLNVELVEQGHGFGKGRLGEWVKGGGALRNIMLFTIPFVPRPP